MTSIPYIVQAHMSTCIRSYTHKHIYRYTNILMYIPWWNIASLMNTVSHETVCKPFKYRQPKYNLI